MGCLKLIYEQETNPLRISNEVENDASNWQVWVGEKEEKEGVDLSNPWGNGFGGFGSNNVTLGDIVGHLWNNPDHKFGGTWTPGGGFSFFQSERDALGAGIAYNNYHNSWGNIPGGATSEVNALQRYTLGNLIDKNSKAIAENISWESSLASAIASGGEGKNSEAISLSLTGALFGNGGGYSVGYFWGASTNGFFITKLLPDQTSNNAHFNASVDYTLFTSADGTEVTFDDILGKDVSVTGDILFGGTIAQPVPFFDDHRSYGDFRIPYISHSVGVGPSIGVAEYNTSTISLEKYFEWLRRQIFR